MIYSSGGGDEAAESRDALTFGFERDDFDVYCAEKAEEAQQLLEVSNAPLLVVSIGSSVDARSDAMSFIGALRESAKHKGVAIVALGRRELREDSLRAGADEFVAWPAFIRDAVTLSRLAIAARVSESGAVAQTSQSGTDVRGELEDYGVYFLVRALASAGRSAVVEIDRASHKAHLHFARGELVTAKVGRLSGVAALHHLLLWGEASLRLRFVSPPGERKIQAPIDDLLQTGVAFVAEFEKLAERVGGPQATFEKRPERFSDPSVKVPPEVRAFAETVVGGGTLVDLVEGSPFKPFDTIKVCYRLCDLGLVSKRDPVRSISPLTAQLAVRDWLLGTATPEPRSTVTEAGRRAAEAYADAAAQRSRRQAAESDELFSEKSAPEKMASSSSSDVERERPPVAIPPIAVVPAAVAPVASAAAEPVAVQAPLAIDDAPTAPREATKGPVARNKRRQKGQPEARAVVVAAAPTPVVEQISAQPESLFDDIDEEFFAKEADLQKLDPVETFDDLDGPASGRKSSVKRKWSLFGDAPTPPPPSNTRKRR